MPFVWQDPEIALIHRGVTIYHTYKDYSPDNMSFYWYTFSSVEPDEDAFDVRDLPQKTRDYSKFKEHPDIIRTAIENGDLKVPEEFQPECKHENLIVRSYHVTDANTQITLSRTDVTGQVFDFEINRIDGEVGAPVFHCEDCGGEFEWEEVKGF